MYTPTDGMSPEHDCIMAKKTLDMAIAEREGSTNLKYNEFYLEKAAAHLKRALDSNPDITFRYDGDEWTARAVAAYCLYLEALNIQVYDKVIRGEDSLLSKLPFRKKNLDLEMVNTLESMGRTDDPKYQCYLTAIVKPENLKKAREVMERAIDLDDENAAYHIEMGRICRALWDTEAAKKHYARAVELDDRPSYVAEAF